MKDKKVLTKFMRFDPKIFIKPCLKLTLPEDFNDAFDSQLRLDDNGYKELANEKYSAEKLQYYAQRMQSVHILSLSSTKANNLTASHMWGLYADSGNGVAFEFDQKAVKEMTNYAPLSSFISKISTIRDDVQKIKYIQSNLNNKILDQLRKFIELANKLDGSSYGTTISIADGDLSPLAEALKTDIVGNAIKLTEVKKKAYLLKEILAIEKFSSIRSLNNHFFKVQYRKSVTVLLDIFKKYWCDTADEQKNLKDISDFMTHKTINWHYEDEHRILNVAYASKIITSIDMELKENRITPIEAREKLKAEINKNLQFINFSNEVALDYTTISSLDNKKNILPILTMPFPESIYLGWNFNISDKYGKYNLALIKEYCKTHKIKNLYQIEKHVDYKNKIFVTKSLEL